MLLTTRSLGIRGCRCRGGDARERSSHVGNSKSKRWVFTVSLLASLAGRAIAAGVHVAALPATTRQIGTRNDCAYSVDEQEEVTS